MKSEMKLLGISCMAVAVVLFAPGYAQDAGGAPAGNAPTDTAAGGMPFPSADSAAIPAGAAPAESAPAGAAPAADDAGGAPAGVAPGGAPSTAGGAPAVAGGAPAAASGGMPPGSEATASAPAAGAPGPVESEAQAAAAAAAAAAQEKMAQQEEKDIAATDAAAAAADKVPIKPLPAYRVPLAAQGLMLDVTQAGNHLVAVGAHGDIVTSTDGTHWTQSQSPVRQTLTSVDFVDADNGWAVGHDSVIVHSADGGKTWTLQAYQPKLQSPLLNVFALDAQHAFAIGAYGQMRETSDGGATWNEVSADNIRGPQLNFYDMTQLADGNLLIAGEQGMVVLSTDRGVSWKSLASPYKGSFFGALPLGDKGALIYGLRGNVYITDDVSTEVWTQVPTNSKNSYFGGTKLADGSFVLVGARGAIMHISADGSTARPLPGPSDQDYDAVLPLGSGLVLAGMRGVQLLKSLH